MKSSKYLQLIALNIRTERLKQNLSQEKLAELANVNRNYVGQIERAENNLTIESLEKISNALNCNIDFTFKPIEK